MCVISTQRETRIAAAWNAWAHNGQFWEIANISKFKCDVVIEGALRSGFFVVAGPIGIPFLFTASLVSDPACVTWYCRMGRT